MKNLSPFAILLCCLFTFIACKKDKQVATPVPPTPPVLTECLETRFEEFKQSPEGTEIVRINHPDGPLYWLINGHTVDEGEPILNEACEVVCTEGCECGGPIILCNGAYFDFPMDTIWKR